MKWSAKPTVGRPEATLSGSAEICANLWYVIDDQGFIYSLRIKLYVCDSTEEEKKAFLLSRVYVDYLVARSFPVPERFGTTFITREGPGTKYPVIHHDDALRTGGLDRLFYDAFNVMEKDLPAQTRLSIPESPLIRITALTGPVDGGDIVPLDSIR